jgi:hypothetical protein
MFKKLFKSKKEKEVKATTNTKVEKVSKAALKNVTGGASPTNNRQNLPG